MGVMQVWHNRSIGTKIFAAFTLVFVTSLGLGLFSLSQTAAVNKQATEIRDDWLPSAVAIAKLAIAVREFRAKEANVMMSALAHDTGSVVRGISEFRKAQAGTKQAYAAFRPLINAGTDDERLMKAFVAAWDRLMASSAQVLDRAGKGDVGGMLAVYLGADRANINEAMDAATADLAFNADKAKKAADRGTATYHSARMMTILVIILCALLCIGAGFALILSVAKPIRRTAVAVELLASGNLDVAVAGVERKDEIGLLARSLEVFKRNAIGARRLAMEQEVDRAAKELRSAYIEGLVRDFEAKTSELVGLLASGSTEVKATARSMTGTADRTKQRATMVASASQEASAGVQTVASAAEELAASINEISQQVAQSARITEKAVSDAQRTDGIVRALAEGAEKIGQVAGLITNIAGQTNLLALNATIEAARAGDAGKGFAVVASEVKSLANQTAKATNEISNQISQIQEATKEAVGAIDNIVATINEISTIATTIASAVEEQGSAIAEIARNVQQTAQAAQEMAENINGVSGDADDTNAAAAQVLSAAGGLSRQAEQLSDEVNGFVAKVRAA